MSAAPLAVGILDQSPVLPGAGPADAVAATVALAEAADAWGYSRYWCAEHHGRFGFADAAPEVLVARLAGATRRIRLGTGGVLLSHYAPLKVAETFRLLEALAPGRIDLGIGRASGSDGATERALRLGTAAGEDYLRRLADLLGFLGDGFPEGHPYAGVGAVPMIPAAPDVWLLGSSGFSARVAAGLGLPFAFAHFIAGDAPQVVRTYRAQFRPSPRNPRPRAIVAVAGFCDDRAGERADWMRCFSLWRARLRTADDPRVPTREEARAHVPTPDERPHIDEAAARAICAGPEGIGGLLRDVLARHDGDEALVVSITPDYASRLRSYELIASACTSPAPGRRRGVAAADGQSDPAGSTPTEDPCDSLPAPISTA